MHLRINIGDVRELATERGSLVELLCACVAAGASIGWVGNLSTERSEQFWDGIIRRVEAHERVVLLARLNGKVVGSVQLNLDTPENGAHRAEVCKLLVHPEVRRQGIARALMERVEAAAIEQGRTLLVLDTGSGNPAELLYRSLGYGVVGVLPRFARSSAGPLESTTIMWKELAR